MTSPLRGSRAYLALVVVLTALCSAAGTVSASAAGQGPPSANALAASAQLVRYPYLTDLTTGSVTVNFATATKGTAPVVVWGVAGSSCTTNSVATSATAFSVSGITEYQRRATIRGLQADSSYCYRLRQGTVDLLGSDPSPTFSTAIPAGSPAPFTFAVLGDWGDANRPGGGNPSEAAVLGLIAESGSRFVVSTGDNAYPFGDQTDYGDLVHTGQNVSAVFAPSLWARVGAGIAGFMPEGNHGISDGAVAELNWPETATVAASGGRDAVDTYCCVDGTSPGSYASTWYAFSFGAARFYVLEGAWANSNVGSGSIYRDDRDAHFAPGTPEYGWLAGDLSAHQGTPKFAFFHFPIYSDNNTEHSDTYLQGSSQLEGLLAANNVRVVFNGHAHIYERNQTAFPQMVSYVTGGGGGLLEPDDHCSGFDRYAVGWSPTDSVGTSCRAPVPTSSAQVFHYLQVSVTGSSVTVTPTDSTGRQFDVQTYPLS